MTVYQNLHKSGTGAHLTRQATIVILGLGEIPVPRRMTVEKAMQSFAYVARNYPGLGYFVVRTAYCQESQIQTLLVPELSPTAFLER